MSVGQPWWGSEIVLADNAYMLDDRDPSNPPYSREQQSVQGINPGAPFVDRIENHAMGWGHSKFVDRGTYDYATSATLHRRFAFQPGPAITEYTPATVPIGPGSFVEYWDGVAAHRRLIVVTPRHVYEIDPSGTVTTFDLGSGFTLANGMLVGKLYKNTGLSTPFVHIARKGIGATDYFVTRTYGTPPTYAVTASNKIATALEPGKDQDGEDVVWRTNENGKLNQSTANANPESSGSWAGSLYSTGSTEMQPVDMIQQAKRLIVWRPDGAVSFDNKAKTVPITSGMENYLSERNGINVKDFNGMAIAGTRMGLIYIDGLDWAVCGPISSNPDARGLTGEEVAFSGPAGAYCYSALYDGTDSWIFMGQPRELNKEGSGYGPFVWHGPVARCEGRQVTDLRVSVVWGTKLWIAFDDGFAACNLRDDGTPETDSPSGDIYFPEGILDGNGPDVIKTIYSAEYIAPAGAPMDDDNTWSLSIDFGSGYVSPGAGDDGTYQKQVYGSEHSARRPRVKLSYTSDGSAELEAIVIRGEERGESRWVHKFRILADPNRRNHRGIRQHLHPETVAENLFALAEAGWQDFVRLNNASRAVKVQRVSELTDVGSQLTQSPRVFEVELAEVP